MYVILYMFYNRGLIFTPITSMVCEILCITLMAFSDWKNNIYRLWTHVSVTKDCILSRISIFPFFRTDFLNFELVSRILYNISYSL